MSILQKAIKKHTATQEPLTDEEALELADKELSALYLKLIQNKNLTVVLHANEDGIFFEVRKKCSPRMWG